MLVLCQKEYVVELISPMDVVASIDVTKEPISVAAGLEAYSAVLIVSFRLSSAPLILDCTKSRTA